jgi:hypothetical protein
MKMNGQTKFSEFLEWLIKHLGCKQCFPTLGERSCFSAVFASSELTLINSHKNKRVFDLDELEKIFEKCKRWPEKVRWQGRQYNHHRWEKSPDRIFAPYVPRLILEFLNEGN